MCSSKETTMKKIKEFLSCISILFAVQLMIVGYCNRENFWLMVGCYFVAGILVSYYNDYMRNAER